MSRGKYQSKSKPFPVFAVVLAVVLAVALTSGGAVAYLSKSADSSVTNTFEADSTPTVTVNEDYTVTVTSAYEVYLRAAVVPNWTYGSNLVVSGGTFTVVPEETGKWIEYGGFYYYTEPISNGTTPPIFRSITADPQSGYTMTVDVAVQTVQALGKTDDDSQTAVVNAWGVQPEGLK